MPSEDQQNGRGEETVSFSCVVSGSFVEAVDRHIHLVKKLKHPKINKSDWIVEAIEKQLERQQNMSASSLNRDRRLSVKIPKILSKAIDSNVEFIKKINASYSKKRWVKDAIRSYWAEQRQILDHPINTEKNVCSSKDV